MWWYVFSKIHKISSDLFSLFMDLEEDWKQIKNSQDEVIMNKYAKYAHKFSICDWCLYSVTTCTYFGEFLIIFFTNTTGNRILLLPATYPFDINPLIRFIPAAIFQSVLFMFMVCSNILSETLLATLVCIQNFYTIDFMKDSIRNLLFHLLILLFQLLILLINFLITK